MRDLGERFALYVDPNDDDDTCWEWMGACSTSTGRNLPYGIMRVKLGSRWRTEYAHRVAFFLASGYWPGFVCHICDNPTCVNPHHLYDGSQRENVRDAVARDRLSHGPRHSEGGRRGKKRAPLSPQAISEILRLYGDGMTQREIADRFGLTQGGVSYVVRWKPGSSATRTKVSREREKLYV
jgi:hypothetical protein